MNQESLSVRRATLHDGEHGRNALVREAIDEKPPQPFAVALLQ